MTEIQVGNWRYRMKEPDSVEVWSDDVGIWLELDRAQHIRRLVEAVFVERSGKCTAVTDEAAVKLGEEPALSKHRDLQREYIELLEKHIELLEKHLEVTLKELEHEV